MCQICRIFKSSDKLRICYFIFKRNPFLTFSLWLQQNYIRDYSSLQTFYIRYILTWNLWMKSIRNLRMIFFVNCTLQVITSRLDFVHMINSCFFAHSNHIWGCHSLNNISRSGRCFAKICKTVESYTSGGKDRKWSSSCGLPDLNLVLKSYEEKIRSSIRKICYK